MIQVAVLGFGTVGSGVVEVLDQNAERVKKAVPEGVAVKYIVDIREFPGNPYEKLLVRDFALVENDPDVQIVVETIGGATIAYDFTKRALLAGKSVVTSNKELVATKGCELLAIAREKKVHYLFEAAVGGGIPVIRPLVQCLAGNNILSICGILNGTTNYILTKMINEALSFDEALKQAQLNGYAEQDPTADVEGHDACRKISILSSLAYGHYVAPELIATEGIRKVSLSDVAFAASAGYAVKLLGRTVRDGNQAYVFVAPHLVDRACPIARVDDVFNAIMIEGDAVGQTMFYGRGAGKLPTASAVVGDIIDVAEHKEKPRRMGWQDAVDGFVKPMDTFVCRRYARIAEKDKKRSEEIFGAVRWLSAGAPAEAAFLTGPLSEREFAEKWMAASIAPLGTLRVL